MENKTDPPVDPWDVLGKYGLTKEVWRKTWSQLEKLLDQFWALKVQAEERAAFDRYYAAYISTQNWGMLTDPAMVADWAVKALKERLKLFPMDPPLPPPESSAPEPATSGKPS